MKDGAHLHERMSFACLFDDHTHCTGCVCQCHRQRPNSGAWVALGLLVLSTGFMVLACFGLFTILARLF